MQNFNVNDEIRKLNPNKITYYSVAICREKKREREREELWKKLHELEISRSNTKMLKNSSNNDLMQSPNITTTSMPSNPFSSAAIAAAAASNTIKTSSTTSAASINPSAGTGDTYNLNKNENVLKD